MDCKTNAVGFWVSGNTATDIGGAELPTTHSGQCAALSSFVPSEPSLLTVSLTMPAEVQITDASCETTMGEATATPRVKANHSSTSLTSQGVLRRVCSGVMARLSVATSQRNMIYIKSTMTDKQGR